MKNKIIIGCALLSAVLGSSCSESFMDVDSPDQLYVDDYFTTKDRIFESLTAAYDPLQWCDYAFGQYTHLGLVSDVMSDDVYVGGNDATDQEVFHKMFNFTAEPTKTINGLWTTMYSGVNRSNVMLENIGNVKDIDAETKALYTAEAKVLRSYYYTWLWKLWGNVPYYEKNLEFPYLTKQLSANEVYNSIVTSLEDAIKNGGLPMRQSSAWTGRVTLAMAYMLYAEVVMYQNDESRYTTALKYMEEIYKSNQYGLVDDFAGIWEASGEWNNESIFEIVYTNTNGKRDWGSALAEGGSVYPKLIGINGLNDPSGVFDGGWGFEPVKASVYALYDDNDQRKNGGILNMAYYASTTGATYSGRYQDEGNFLKKYIARVGGNANATASADMNYGNNFRVYRYSETLLNAAELIARGATGGVNSASFYLELVRRRANPSAAAIDASVDNILAERRLEFVGEGKRYWDLVRSGKAASTLVPDGKYRVNAWTESKKYLPIPSSELDSDPALVQNPY